MADKKIGAYICQGCGIGDRLDSAQLAKTAQRDGKAQVVKEHEFLCNADGVATIQEDIKNEELTHVVIAACSRRAKTEAFSFDDVALSRANLREGVIWVRPNTEEAQETTQEMADDYIRMACAEAKHMTAAEAGESAGLNKHLLVVGGGVSGLTAALEAAKAGYQATIVEKEGQLGGLVGQFYKKFPASNGLQGPVDTGIDALIQEVEGNDRISVMLNSLVAKTEGSPGQFTVEVATESGSSQNVEVGAIVQATGSSQYDLGQLPELGGGKSPDVVDQLGLEKLVKEAGGGPVKRPSDGKEIQSVAFVQCAGQRSDEEGKLPYCSGHCCQTSIKQAMYLRELNQADTTVLFDDLRTPGAAGEDFYRAGQEAGVTFSKGTVTGVDTGGGLKVNFKDEILDEETAQDADLVVLATGMVPMTGPDPYAQLAVEEAETEEEKEAAQKKLENAPPSVLNLEYRQGTDVPHLKHGFTDSHFICFPYETRRTGIYTTGPVRRPMDSAQAREDAVGAAMKAIQACENAAQGRAAHPRSGDLSFPKVRLEGCTQCKRCTVECPFGAINEDEQRYPVFNESRCRRCGTCMGACPVRVISFDNYSVDTVGQQIKNCDIPDEFDEKPRILVLACENDAYPALDMAGMNNQEVSPFARIIPVRCLGSVNAIWVTDALNSGYDGVMLMGCQKGENYQCHFVKGSEMAHVRMSKIDDTLQSLQLEKERVQTFEVSITDIERIPQLINEMESTINEIGMSPFKF